MEVAASLRVGVRHSGVWRARRLIVHVCIRKLGKVVSLRICVHQSVRATKSISHKNLLTSLRAPGGTFLFFFPSRRRPARAEVAQLPRLVAWPAGAPEDRGGLSPLPSGAAPVFVPIVGDDHPLHPSLADIVLEQQTPGLRGALEG